MGNNYCIYNNNNMINNNNTNNSKTYINLISSFHKKIKKPLCRYQRMSIHKINNIYYSYDINDINKDIEKCPINSPFLLRGGSAYNSPINNINIINMKIIPVDNYIKNGDNFQNDISDILLSESDDDFIVI